MKFIKTCATVLKASKSVWQPNHQRYRSTEFGISNMFSNQVKDLLSATPNEIRKYLDSFDTVLTDCDGVLWVDNAEIADSSKVLNGLRKLGKKIFYVTNNSTKQREDFAKKAQSLGFIASKDEILSTAFLAAHYLQSINFKDKAYVIGSDGIADELDAIGVKHIGIGPDYVQQDFKAMKQSDLDPEVKAVIVGFDQHISYPKLMKAATYLASDDCLFIATNTDERFPRQDNTVVPGTGAIVKAVETCSQRTPLVLGKPHNYVRKFLESKNLNPSRTIMIGDRCNTDIELGVRSGFQTLLVLSGVTSIQDLENIRQKKTPPLPDVVLPKLGNLLPFVTNYDSLN